MIEPAGRFAKICTAENYSKINELAKNRTGPVEPPSLSAVAAGTARCPSPVPAASVTGPSRRQAPEPPHSRKHEKNQQFNFWAAMMRMPQGMLSRLRLSARVAAAARNLSPARLAWVRGWCPSRRRAPRIRADARQETGSGEWSISFPRRSTANISAVTTVVKATVPALNWLMKTSTAGARPSPPFPEEQAAAEQANRDRADPRPAGKP